MSGDVGPVPALTSVDFGTSIMVSSFDGDVDDGTLKGRVCFGRLGISLGTRVLCELFLTLLEDNLSLRGPSSSEKGLEDGSLYVCPNRVA